MKINQVFPGPTATDEDKYPLVAFYIPITVEYLLMACVSQYVISALCVFNFFAATQENT